jgi:hypothetical protein
VVAGLIAAVSWRAWNQSSCKTTSELPADIKCGYRGDLRENLNWINKEFARVSNGSSLQEVSGTNSEIRKYFQSISVLAYRKKPRLKQLRDRTPRTYYSLRQILPRDDSLRSRFGVQPARCGCRRFPRSVTW